MAVQRVNSVVAQGIDPSMGSGRNARGQFAGPGKGVSALSNLNKELADLQKNSGWITQGFGRIRGPLDNLYHDLERGDLRLRSFSSALSNFQELWKRQAQLANASFLQRGVDKWGNPSGVLLAPPVESLTTWQRMSARIRTAGSLADGFATRMIKVGKNIQWAGRQITVGFFVPLAFAAHAAKNAFLELDRQLTRVTKVYDIEVGMDIENRTKSIRNQVRLLGEDLAKSFGTKSTEIVEVAANYAQMGHTLKDTGGILEHMTTETIRIAKLGEIELAQATELVRSVQAVWQMDVEELTNTLNEFNAVENATALETREIAEALPKVSGVFKELNVTAGEGVALLAAMKEKGVEATEGAHALKFSLTRLIDPTEEAVKKWQELTGLNLEGMFKRLGGEAIPMLMAISRALSQVENDAERLDLVAQLVGRRQSDRIVKVFNSILESSEGTDNALSRALGVLGQFEENAEAAKNELDAIFDSAAGRADRASAAMQIELQKIGEHISAIWLPIKEVMTGILEFINGMGPSTRKLILIILGLVAAFSLGAMALGLITNLFGQLTKVITSVIPKMQVFTAEQAAANAIAGRGANMFGLWAQQIGLAGDEMAYLNQQGIRYNNTLGQWMGPGGRPMREIDVGNMLVDRQQQLRGSRLGRLSQAMVGPKAFGILGATSMVSMMGESFVPANSGAKQLLDTLSKISGVGMVIMSLFTAFPSPWTAVVAGIAAALLAIKAFAGESQKAFNSLEASKKLADSMGITWDETGKNIVDAEDRLKQATKELNRFSKENAELIKEVKKAKGPGAKQALLTEIAYDLKIHGASEEQIKEAVRRIATEAEIENTIDLKVMLDENSIQDAFVTNLKNTLLGPDTRNILGKAKDMWSNANKELVELFSGAPVLLGGREAARISDAYAVLGEHHQNGIKNMAQRIQETIRSQSPDAAMRLIDMTFGSLDEISVALADGVPGRAAQIRRALEIVLAQEIAKGFGGVELQLIDSKNSLIHVLFNSADDLFEAYKTVIRHIDRLNEAILRGEDETVISQMRDDLARARGEFVESQRAVADYTEEQEGLGEAIGDTTGGINKQAEELKSLGQTYVDALKNTIMDQLDKVRDAALETFEEHKEQQLKQFDKEIGKIKEVGKKEIELDKLREHLARLDEIRRDEQLNSITKNLEIEFALKEGNLADAAILREELYADSEKFAIEASQEVGRRAKEIQEKARKELEDSLDKQQELLEEQLDLLLEFAPTSKAEFNKVLREVKNLLEKFGVQDLPRFMDIFDQQLNSGWSDAFEHMRRTVENDEAWRRIGENVGDWFGRGVMNSLDDVIKAWESGKLPKNKKKNKTEGSLSGGGGGGGDVPGGLRPSPSGSGGDPNLDMILHSGGFVSGGHKADIPATLQEGEFVVQRKAVDALGIPFLSAINNYHQGGAVHNPFGHTVQNKGMRKSLLSYVASRIFGGPGSIGEDEFTRSGEWPPRVWRKLSENTQAAMKFIRQSWRIPFGIGTGLSRDSIWSDHPWGKALDVMMAPLGQFANKRQRAAGWEVANWFVRNPGRFGTKYVIWDGLINSGSGWRKYKSNFYDVTKPTGGHYDHVHLSFMHEGGLVKKIPSLDKGGFIKQDTLANLHKGEAVLTAPLTKQIMDGGTYEVNVNVRVDTMIGEEKYVDALANKVGAKVVHQLDVRNRNRGIKRPVG